MSIELIIGPPVNAMERTAAEQALLQFPGFPEGAEYTVSTHAGHWIAAYRVKPPEKKEAQFKRADSPFGGPADSDEESPAPKSEGPDDTAPDSDDGGDGPPKDDGDGPPEGLEDGDKDKGSGGKAGAELHKLLDLLTSIADALGVPIHDEGGLAGPPDDGLLGPPGPPPPHSGPEGPPAPPDKTIHEKSLKPGEVPPGGTPLGAPAFASISPNHPWAHALGVVSHFRVAEEIGDVPLTEVESELQSLASAGGFKVSQFRPLQGEHGERIASALITVPTQ